MNEYRKAISDSLYKVSARIEDIGQNVHWHGKSQEDWNNAVSFLDSCCWALAFGGPFGDEVVCLASEVLQEGIEYDPNWKQDMDNR